MNRNRASLAVLTIVLLSGLSALVAGPARAGGPTSVLLVEPATEGSTALYYSDDDYQALERLVSLDGATGGGKAGSVDGSGAAHETGSAITVTWLAHDVTVWRVNRIHLDAEGGPWIATQQMDGEDSLWDSPVVWHTSADGEALSALLGRLGLGAGVATRERSPVTADVAGNPRTLASATPGSVPRADAALVGESRTPAAPLWALLGLALGVVGTVTALRLVPGRTDVLARRQVSLP